MHYIPESARELLADDAAAPGSDSPDAAAEPSKSGALFLLTWLVGGLLLADVLLSWFAPPEWQTYRTLFGFRLSLLAAVVGGARIVFQTVEGLLVGRVGADLALTIATLAAILLGEYETAALVVFIAMCGEALEAVTVERARRALASSFQLSPPTALRLRNGRQEEVAATELVPGDLVLVRAGDRVPVDGAITAGNGTFNEQSVTGESLPVERGVGERVFAGTLNESGAVEVLARQVGRQTVVAQVREAVVEAARRKSEMERLADRLARWFLPAVLAATVLTLLGWRLTTGGWGEAWLPALAVLVVACPCPLVLATPAAVMSAMAWLARHGVVTKGAAALERLADVETFAFDKTGTLTQGTLEPAMIWTTPRWSADEVLRLASMVEKQSSHPLARLIVAVAEQRGLAALAAARTEIEPGLGLSGWVSPHAVPPDMAVEAATGEEGQIQILVGSPRLLIRHQVTIPDGALDEVARADELGQTSVLVAVAGELAGIITAADVLRADAASVLSELREDGITHFALLTGDRAATATAVAEELGPVVNEVQAELLPDDKRRWVADRKSAGHRVAMVGDGINDAPALAEADVGLAIGRTGTDLAAHAGDLVLMGEPLATLPGLLKLSKALVKNIRQSVFLFAFGVNGLGVLLSATGVLSPVAAALFHEVASAAVMLNALRLLAFNSQPASSRPSTSMQDGWSELTAIRQQFSPNEIADALWNHRAKWLRFAGALLVMVWLAGNIVCVREGEQAVVTRFGRHAQTLNAGWHWSWPWPLEQVVRHPVHRTHTVAIGFRRLNDATPGPVPHAIEWTSDHRDGGLEPMPDEATVLTGDELPVELAAEVEYRVDDLAAYVFVGGDRAEDVVRSTAEAWLRGIIAARPLAEVLTESRREMELACLQELRRQPALAAIGVDVQLVCLLEVHPPAPVVPAYRDVADALEQREELRNQAEGYARRRLLSAVGEEAADRILSVDIGDDESQSVLDRIDWDRWLTEFQAGDTTLNGEAAAVLHEAMRNQTEAASSAAGTAARWSAMHDAYTVHPQLSSEQLYLKTLRDRLTGRPLTIIDPAVIDRGHIWLRDGSDMSGPTPSDPTVPPQPLLLPSIPTEPSSSLAPHRD